MFLEPFLLMLLLVTLVMLVTPLTTISLVLPKKKQRKASITLINTFLIIRVVNVKIHSLSTLLIKMR